jgi:hypothetical protein
MADLRIQSAWFSGQDGFEVVRENGDGLLDPTDDVRVAGARAAWDDAEFVRARDNHTKALGLLASLTRDLATKAIEPKNAIVETDVLRNGWSSPHVRSQAALVSATAHALEAKAHKDTSEMWQAKHDLDNAAVESPDNPWVRAVNALVSDGVAASATTFVKRLLARSIGFDIDPRAVQAQVDLLRAQSDDPIAQRGLVLLIEVRGRSRALSADEIAWQAAAEANMQRLRTEKPELSAEADSLVDLVLAAFAKH